MPNPHELTGKPVDTYKDGDVVSRLTIIDFFSESLGAEKVKARKAKAMLPDLEEALQVKKGKRRKRRDVSLEESARTARVDRHMPHIRRELRLPSRFSLNRS